MWEFSIWSLFIINPPEVIKLTVAVFSFFNRFPLKEICSWDFGMEGGALMIKSSGFSKNND
jgi:hypothetical protein